MLKQFIHHVNKQHLFPTGQQVLLAVSGGVDSVVLAHLMHTAAFPFAIAHCNFNLRPDDCDRDELFVRNLAQHYRVPFHVIHFDTISHARLHHQSIEEAARQLRYDWFNQLCDEHGYPALLTAHHRDDSAETFFINLMRGTGLSGLHGILPVQGRVVRPLLPFGRDEIERYASQQALAHVEDSTNASLDYCRNRVRHQLLPLLRQMQPAADRSLARTIAHLQSVERLYRALLAPIVSQCVTTLQDGTVRISLIDASLSPLFDDPELRHQLLFELLHPYGFNSSTIAEMSSATRSGSLFRSATHQAVLHRGAFLLSPLHEGQEASALPELIVERYSVAQLSLDPRHLPANQALFDADAVRLPLSLRHWQQADRFQPFGMKQGTQLVSDYFTDHKFSLLDKQRQLLLVDASGAILWIVGHRTAHPFRLTAATSTVLSVSIPL